MPTTEGTMEMSLDAANKAAISMVEDHPKNSHQHELKLHTLSAKAERLLWHQHWRTTMRRRLLILSEPQEAQERVVATARDDTRGFVLHAISGASNAYD